MRILAGSAAPKDENSVVSLDKKRPISVGKCRLLQALKVVRMLMVVDVGDIYKARAPRMWIRRRGTNDVNKSTCSVAGKSPLVMTSFVTTAGTS